MRQFGGTVGYGLPVLTYVVQMGPVQMQGFADLHHFQAAGKSILKREGLGGLDQARAGRKIKRMIGKYKKKGFDHSENPISRIIWRFQPTADLLLFLSSSD